MTPAPTTPASVAEGGRVRIKSLKFLPPVFPGWKRTFVECCHCKMVFADQYQPYSLSNPIRTLPCGHRSGDQTLRDDQDAMRRMIDQRVAALRSAAEAARGEGK